MKSPCKNNQISPIGKLIYLSTIAFGCPFSGISKVSAFNANSASSSTLITGSITVGDLCSLGKPLGRICNSKTGTSFFYQHGDDAESNSRRLQHRLSAVFTFIRRSVTSPWSSLEPKDDFEKYVEYLWNRYYKLHNECIVYDDHCPREPSESHHFDPYEDLELDKVMRYHEQQHLSVESRDSMKVENHFPDVSK
mmetsp:Transcript_3605/g.5368  ORF Transcript_3605/g.5368 Transcript_3605/m.5368 type:complete len:194 (-) Transcript_3605:17-598(-)